jgi:hypothetical protein
MATPQAGIFALGTRTRHHLEYDVGQDAGAADVAAVLARGGEPSVTGGGSNIVIRLGAALSRSPAAIAAARDDLAAVSG